jgi:hypothetical protein
VEIGPASRSTSALGRRGASQHAPMWANARVTSAHDILRHACPVAQDSFFVPERLSVDRAWAWRARDVNWPSSRTSWPKVSRRRRGGLAASRDKVGRNKAIVPAFRLRPCDADHIRYGLIGFWRPMRSWHRHPLTPSSTCPTLARGNLRCAAPARHGFRGHAIHMPSICWSWTASTTV